jgi:hypothetical protein
LGIGQESFDARFATELKALRAMGSAAGVVGSTYVHEGLGIAFACPPDWRPRDRSEVQEGIDKRLVSRNAGIMNGVVRELSLENLPLVVLAAPTLDDPIARLGADELAPLIALQFEETVVEDAESPFDLFDHVDEGLFYSRAFVEDYRLLRRPERTALSGCDAVAYTAAYTTLRSDAVDGCPVRERTYYFMRGPAIYTIRMCDYPDRDPRLAFDFTSFVESICLT